MSKGRKMAITLSILSCALVAAGVWAWVEAIRIGDDIGASYTFALFIIPAFFLAFISLLGAMMCWVIGSNQRL